MPVFKGRLVVCQFVTSSKLIWCRFEQISVCYSFNHSLKISFVWCSIQCKWLTSFGLNKLPHSAHNGFPSSKALRMPSHILRSQCTNTTGTVGVKWHTRQESAVIIHWCILLGYTGGLYEGLYLPRFDKFPVVFLRVIDISIFINFISQDISLNSYIISLIPRWS